MSNDRSVFSFELNESLFFEKGQEVAEMRGISLDPEITIQSFNEYISIRGIIELHGEYERAWSTDEESEAIDFDDYHVKRYVERVINTVDSGAEFSHRFPVEISVPTYRVSNLDDVTVIIESFDYEIPEQNQLKLYATIDIYGINQEIQMPRAQEEAIEAIEEEADKTHNEVEALAETEREIEAKEELEEIEREIETAAKRDLEETEKEIETAAKRDLEETEKEVETVAKRDLEETEKEIETEVKRDLKKIEKEVETAAKEDLQETEITDADMEVKEARKDIGLEGKVKADEKVEANAEQESTDRLKTEREIGDTFEFEVKEKQAKKPVEESGLTNPINPPTLSSETEDETNDPDRWKYQQTKSQTLKEFFQKLPSQEEVVSPEISEEQYSLDSGMDAQSGLEEEIMDSSDMYESRESAESRKEPVKEANYLSELFRSTEERQYTQMRLCIVQNQDTIETIAERYHVSALQLIKQNQLDGDYTVTEGQLLYIPDQTKK